MLPRFMTPSRTWPPTARFFSVSLRPGAELSIYEVWIEIERIVPRSELSLRLSRRCSNSRGDSGWKRPFPQMCRW
jgi:hypothetical protein